MVYMKAMMVRFLNVVLVFLLGIGATGPSATRAAHHVWLVASDIHLNPYNHSPDPALVGSDTNLTLFAAAMAEMKRHVPDPAVVLLPGDFFVHDFPKVVARRGGGVDSNDAGLQTMRYVATAFARAYPRARFAIALGNNDAPCGDYRANVSDAYLRAVANIWAPLVNRDGAAPDFVSTFSRAGYYTAALPVRGLRLVVLNTVLFSSEYHGACPGGSDTSRAATDELSWLRDTLRATPGGARNVVMMHVPPGFDAFSTEFVHGYLPWAFLNSYDNDALVAALSDPDNRVAYAIAAHTHRFDVRLVGSVPMIVVGSISPVYHGNPTYYGFHMLADGSIGDIVEYPFDEWNQEWGNARSFDQKWDVAHIDAATLGHLHERLASDPALRHTWDAQSAGWPANFRTSWEMWGASWRVPWCAQSTLTGGFAQCAGIERRVVLLRAFVAAIVVLLLTVLTVIAVALVRRRNAVRMRRP